MPVPVGMEKTYITGIYLAFFGRQPDAAVIDAHVAYLKRKGPLGYVKYIASAPERRRAEITELYREALGREPDAPGLDGWVANGLPISTIREHFYASDEAIARLTASAPPPAGGGDDGDAPPPL